MNICSATLATLSAAAFLGISAPTVLAVPPPEAPQVSVETDASAYPDMVVVVTMPAATTEQLLPEAFTLSEGGTPVTATVDRVPTDNLEVALVMDTSGSMRGESLAAAKAAAIEFVGLLPPEVKVALIGFGDEPYLVTPLTVDHSVIANGIADLRAGGETALYDGLLFAIMALSGDATRAMVVLTDGEDTASITRLPDALDAVTPVKVQVVELAADEGHRETMKQLAAAGNGSVYSVSDTSGLAEVYHDVASTLVSQYVLRYHSSASGPTEINVHVETSGGPLDHNTTVKLPTVPALPSTSLPITTAATAAAPPATVATEESVPSGIEATATPSSSVAPSGLLTFGGTLLFAAFLLLALVAMPVGGTERKAMNMRLSLRALTTDTPRPSQLGEGLSAAAERLLQRHGRRNSLAQRLECAGISLRPGEFAVLLAALTLVAALLLVSLYGPAGLMAGLVLTPLSSLTIVGIRVDRRRQKFHEFLPDSLQLLSSAMRAGYGISHAFDAVAADASEPLRSEFRRVVLESRVGRDMVDSLRALQRRMDSADFKWVVSAIDINREVGGDLATVLENVAETIRERQRLVRQMRALSAEGRMSAYVLIFLPIAMGLMLAATNGTYLRPLFQGTGLALVGVGVLMLVIGWIWMNRLIKVEY